MFFPSTGYSKRKYSLALPAGVAIIGIIFLVIGSIIAIRFPSLVTDWTKADVCITAPTDKRYESWAFNSDRDVTVSVQVQNLTNLASVLRYRDNPKFEWSGPFEFKEHSRKTNVEFLNDHHVAFVKDAVYLSAGSTMAMVTFPNFWLFRHYSSIHNASSWLYDVVPQLLINFDWKSYGFNSPSAFWGNISINDCTGTSSSKLSKVCPAFSFVNLARESNAFEQENISIPIVLSLINALSVKSPRHNSSNNCSQLKSDQCLACFSQMSPLSKLLLQNQLLIKFEQGHDVWSHLKFCYSQIEPAYASIANHDFYNILYLLNNYFFHHLRKKLLLNWVSQRGLFQSDDLVRVINSKPINSEYNLWTLGILPAIFGAGDHSYDWNTCNMRWEIDADINFEWRSLDSRPVEWKSKSEYFISPPPRINPCSSPPAPKRLPFMLEGLWRPAMFSFNGTAVLHGETVYVYVLTAGDLPYDDLLSPATKINITNIIGFPAYVFPLKGNATAETVAKIWVEPITGVVWKVKLSFELHVMIQDDLLKAANVSQLSGVQLPVVRVSRSSQIHPDATVFLNQQLKPMLRFICGGTVGCTTLAVLSVGLAIALVVKPIWKPFMERTRVHPEPQDLEMLNTIKLRKLLGN